MRLTGINIQDQITLEVIGQQTLYTIPDDIVYYGGTVFRCTTGHRSAPSNKFVNPNNNIQRCIRKWIQIFYF